ncbi:MAG: c-type cytochrome [Gammaproteobacteria bacterium]
MACLIFNSVTPARLLLAAYLVLTGTTITFAFELGTPPRLGAPVSAADSAARDNLVFPDGSGLPAGTGNVEQGANLFVQQCVLCHGPNGRGGSAEELSGGIADLTRDPPDQTIGTYWPHATTLFDFIRRAMPMHIPGSLTNEQCYALTAYLLYENGILGEDAELNAERLKNIKMPNRGGFIWIDVDKDGHLR